MTGPNVCFGGRKYLKIRVREGTHGTEGGAHISPLIFSVGCGLSRPGLRSTELNRAELFLRAGRGGRLAQYPALLPGFEPVELDPLEIALGDSSLGGASHVSW